MFEKLRFAPGLSYAGKCGANRKKKKNDEGGEIGGDSGGYPRGRRSKRSGISKKKKVQNTCLENQTNE